MFRVRFPQNENALRLLTELCSALRLYAIAINDVQVYTWGKGYCGALGHGVETDHRTPLLVAALKGCRAVQVAVAYPAMFTSPHSLRVIPLSTSLNF